MLDLWHDDRTAPEIAARLKMRRASAVMNIIVAARRRGDVRAHRRVTGPAVRRVGSLPQGLVPMAQREAKARGCTTSALCLRILETVFREGMLLAVLDDGPAEDAGRMPAVRGPTGSAGILPALASRKEGASP